MAIPVQVRGVRQGHSTCRPFAIAGRGLNVLLVLLGLLFSAPALAQSTLAGAVVDPQGSPVSGASVVVSGGTIAPPSVRTDSAGRFLIEGLADGTYDITASAPGLIGELRGLSVSRAQRTSVDMVMRISALTESLVVSAAQIDQPLSRTADSVTIVTGGEIESRQLTSLGEALRTVPGFTSVQSGGPGTLTSIFPRGGESDYTLVLVDGIRANGFGGGIDLSQVPITAVDRIEVVRGPQSAIFGADAIGGVVQIITRQGGHPTAHAQIEGGSRATRRLRASTAGTANAWRWQGGGDYFRDEGFTGVAPATLAGIREHVSNDDARERQGWAGAGWRGGTGTDVQGVFRYVDTERGAPGPYGADPARRFFGVDRISRGMTSRRSAGLRVVQPWTGPASRVRQRVDFDVADFDLSFVSAFGPSESETRRVHGRVQTDAALDGGVGLSGGVEWFAERAGSTFITAGADTVPVERRVIGTFGEARWNASDRLTVQAGLRAEHITRDPLAANPSPFAPRPAFAADTIVSVNPKVAVSWLLSRDVPSGGARSWTRLHLAAGTGIRPPDAFELAFTDNPGLEPERSRSVDAGVAQTLAGGAVHLDATMFFNQYDDLIISVGSLRDVSRYRTDNVSNARTRGLELSAAWQATRGLGLRAAYTYLDTAIQAVDGSAQAPSPYRVGDALLRRPRHQGSITADWTRSRLTAFATLNARGETLDAEPAFGPSGGLYVNPGRRVLDSGGAYRVAGSISVFARVLNVFDRAYEDALGFPAPGRTAFDGVRVAAGR
ncbi:MAG: TonB-dependent receptor [Acidobacteriota bacterium]